MRLAVVVATLALACATAPPAPPDAPWVDLSADARADRLVQASGLDLRHLALPDAVLRFLWVDGQGEARAGATLFVHGLNGALGDFAPVLLAAARGQPAHPVVALDLPGWGGSQSRSGDHRVTGYAKVVAAFIERVGIAPVHLACHSLGGQVCIALAIERRDLVRTLTLVSPAGVYRAPQYLRGAARRFGGINVGTVGGGDPTRSIVAVLTHADGDLFQRFVTRDRSTLAMLSSFRENQRDRLPRLRVPTLVIWGAADPILPMRDGFVIAATVPGAVLHVVEDGGHETQLTHAELVHGWMEEHRRRH